MKFFIKKIFLLFLVSAFSFTISGKDLTNTQLLGGATLLILGTAAATTSLASTGLCIGFSASNAKGGGVMSGYGRYMAIVYSGLAAISTGAIAAISVKEASKILQIPYGPLLKKTGLVSTGLLGTGIIAILGKWTYDTLQKRKQNSEEVYGD